MSYEMPCIVVIGFAKLWLGLDNHITTLGPAKLITASNSEPYNSKLKKERTFRFYPIYPLFLFVKVLG